MTGFGRGIPPPEPGYYPGLPMDVYREWDACSNGRLSVLKNRSPAHVVAKVLEGTHETPALRLGKAIHMAILEPELFGVRYGRKERCVRSTKAGDRCENQGSLRTVAGDVVCRRHVGDDEVDADVELLNDADWDTCVGMRDRARAKVRAAGLISGHGEFELSLVWHEDVEVTTAEGELVTVRVPMKGRIDRYTAMGGGTLLDLKSAQDASRDRFERAIFNYGYHQQLGLYMRGARKVGLPARHATIMAAEKAPPYEIAVYRLTEGALDAGEEMAMALLKQYALCMHTGDWVGYPDKVQDIHLPDWAWSRLDNDLRELEDTWET